MEYFGVYIFVLGLPLLVVYALQPREKKNKLWLTIGLLFILVSIGFCIMELITSFRGHG